MLYGLRSLLFNPTYRSEWRWHVIAAISKRLLPNYRILQPHIAWWQDEEFNAFLKKFHEYGDYNTDRRWNIHQLCKLARNVPGDTAECGVMEGSSSYLIAKAFPDRTHHAFDSFEGCSAPSGRDNGYFFYGTLAIDLATAQRQLADCSNIAFYKGWIPNRFPEISDRRFAFVHIDVQQEQPTGDSLEFFYRRMNAGGIIVLDDYGFTNCPGARKVVDEFMADKPEPIIELANGSGFLVRAHEVTPQ
jgi:O-methyltransferase